MVEVTGLTKCYGENTVVNHISFRLEKGQVYGLLGPNGAGKSTTMKMLTGCLFPTAGTIAICGHDLLQQPEQAKRRIGYLPERPPLYPAMTPREYLLFMAELKGVPAGERAAQVGAVMERTQIAGMQHRLIKFLSKGYCQRVGIAQALLGSPEVLILDEPMVGLDPAQIIELRGLIRELGRSHTVILSSHILAEVSAACNRVLILSNGTLIANDTVENLRALVQGKDVLTVTAACSPQEARAALEGIDGAGRIEASPNDQGGCTVLLYPKPGCDIQSAVLSCLNGAGHRVIQMGVDSMPLEEVFLSLLAQGGQAGEGEKS